MGSTPGRRAAPETGAPRPPDGWSEASEEQRVAAAKAGDRGAFRALYLRNVSDIFRYIARRVPTREEAEDLTAETFCRAWAGLGGYEWRGVPFGAWLSRIAQNLLASRGRRAQVARVVGEIREREATETFEDDLVSGLEAAPLREALAELTGQQRQVVECRFLEDLTVAETATVVGCSEGAVRALTFRALQTIRQAYGSDKAPGR